MKIAILGTRGIPNNYGGFEQFADLLSQGLVKKGFNITVYCSANHIYQQSEYKGVKLIHKYDPENRIGTAGQFIYDLGCMIDALKQDFDIIYMLGYTSSSIWQKLIFKKGPLVITNMDGLEWKRSKYSKLIQNFLQYAEKLAVRYSDYLIADSAGIKKYLKEKYNVESTYHPYGSFVFTNPNEKALEKYNLLRSNYDILIARFEPENNIEMILEAFSKSAVKREFILVGNYMHTHFGKTMYARYQSDLRIRFIGSIYDQEDLNNLRYFSNLYYHGHSVGGTNPSLLEAMGSSALICYHNNIFNHSIIGNDGFPFSNSKDLEEIINTTEKSSHKELIDNNILKIETIYNWDIITTNYMNYFNSIVNKSIQSKQ